MRAIVSAAILVLVLMLAGLVVYLLLRRAATGVRSAVERRRQALLEAALDAWLVSADADATGHLPRPATPLDRRLFVALCLQRLPRSDASDRARLTHWLESAGYIDRWIRQLGARSAWRRAAAAERLGIVRSPHSVEPLIGALDDAAFDVRMRAAKALGALGGASARQALVGALADENRWSVIRISDLLAEMGPEVVGELVDAFPRVPRASQLATLDLIGQVGDATLTPFLTERLDDLDRDIRARAASALARVGDRRAAPRLAAALQDAEWPVRAMAAKALGALGSADAVEPLARSLRDREWWVRCNAAEALTRLAPEGLSRLVSLLDDQDRFARDQALSMLESTGELAARLGGLTSPDSAARARALALLGVLTTRFPRERVDALRDQLPDTQVRNAINVAMREPVAGGGAA